MIWREVYQLLSIFISAYSLWLIVRKIRRRPRSFGLWLPMSTIMVLTLTFYGLIQFDRLGQDAAEWSSMRSMAIQIALLIYVRNMPPENPS